MTWLLRWTLNGDFSLILLQLVKEQLTHDVGHWALLQGMKRQFSLAKVTWLGLLDRKHSLSSCCFFSGQMWRQGFILGKIFHCWPHLVGWLDGLEAFLLLTDHFHRRPGATVTVPPTHHPNVKMFIIKPLVFDLCSLLSFVASQSLKSHFRVVVCGWKTQMRFGNQRRWDLICFPKKVKFDLISKKSQRYLIKGCDRLQWKESGGGGWKWRQSDDHSEGCQEWTSRPATSKVNLNQF